MNFGRIVVGVDGSDNAGRALACAVDLARATDAEVVAVHSVGLLERLASSQSHEVDPATVDIRHEFETVWCALLNDADVRSLRLVRDGNPVSVLLDVADEVGADLIVVGSRGLGGYPELLLGSTSTQVAQHSSRPVLIVPSAQGPASQ